jgi:hypothetical protein
MHGKSFVVSSTENNLMRLKTFQASPPPLLAEIVALEASS